MKQGEIWDVSIGRAYNTGSEEVCSVLIINDDIIETLPSRLIAPLAEWHEKFSDAIWLIRVDPNKENNLKRASVIDAFQLHAIPTSSFIKRIGRVSMRELQHIKKAIQAIISS